MKELEVAPGLVAFQFDSWRVRILDRNGQPWWVLSDVCAILGIGNSRDVAARLTEAEKDVGQIDTPGGRQSVNIVNESGLYKTIFRSDKPEARRFETWVTSEVLPAIRKTGIYSTSGFPVPRTLPEALRLAADLEEKRLALAAKVEADAPKVEGYERFLDASGTMCISDAAKALGQGPASLFHLLASKKAIFRRGGEWVATQDYIDRGWLIVRALKIPDLDKGGAKVQTRVTAKGLAGISRMIPAEAQA